MIRLVVLFCFLLTPVQALALVVSGVVSEASTPESITLEGVDIGSFEQIVIVDTGEERVRFRNDFVPVEVGQKVFVRREDDGFGGELISLYDIDRSGVIYAIMALFVGLVLLLHFRKGLKSLFSLVITIITVFFILLPALKNGYSPALVGSTIAIVLLAVVMLFTHGFRAKTYVAMVGTSLAIIITTILTLISLKIGRFTGIGNDESFSIVVSGLPIDMPELLFVGILIGMLGVLDDVAITQASATQQLYHAGARGRALFLQAMKIGQDHVGALVNTLVLAYTGAALPLLLLTTLKTEPLPALLSIEVLATEIMRALLGSIGVILAVPLTTFLAVLFVRHMQKGYREGDHDGHVH